MARNDTVAFLPLYRLHSRTYDLRELKQNPNAGLWYEKFCNQWTWDKNKNEKVIGIKLKKNKGNWIKAVTKNLVGDCKGIKRAVDRIEALVKERHGKMISMKTTSRFIPGMGRPHPVENGINWHPTLGVPYLPGSSVKGMVRAWAESYDQKKDEETIARIFGPKDLEKSVGSVIFFDALPKQHICLVMDIMTPHHSNYYQGKTKNPHEWESPNPIPFLAVDEGQKFVFAIAPRRLQDQEDLEKVEHWLKEALESMGAGAKTAVGYGRFKRI